jgi:hypothetical protein
MAITDIRQTALQIINEVRRKLGLRTVSALSDDSQAIVLTDHLNDIVAEISDFGNWQESLVSANTAVQSSVRDYSVNTSAVVKNIRDIYYVTSVSNQEVNLVNTEQMRRYATLENYGQPHSYSIFGTDSNGNPNIRLWPVPASAQSGAVLSILAYTKPPIYTTADGATIVPFPSRLVVQGVLAYALLDEDGGSETNHFASEYSKFQNMLKEAFNRFNSDTGYAKKFVPAFIRNGRR